MLVLSIKFAAVANQFTPVISLLLVVAGYQFSWLSTSKCLPTRKHPPYTVFIRINAPSLLAPPPPFLSTFAKFIFRISGFYIPLNSQHLCNCSLRGVYMNKYGISLYEVNHFSINILGNQVSPAQSVRNLGVVFDSNFNFSNHVSQVIKSTRDHARDLYRIRPLLDLNTSVLLANALVSSRLDYYNSLFLSLTDFELRRLQSKTHSAGLSPIPLNSLTLPLN